MRTATSSPCIANYLPDSKSGTPGADSYKVKGNIHWVSAAHAYAAEVRLYDRLFKVPAPGARREAMRRTERDFLADLNPDSAKIITAQLEPGLRDAGPKNASSSSATAISSPTASTPSPARRCSTAR